VGGQNKSLFGDFSAKVGKETFFSPQVGMKVYMKFVMILEFDTSKHLTIKNTMFPHHNTHKYICTSPDGKSHNQNDNNVRHR
jgi:hypothetical protein